MRIKQRQNRIVPAKSAVLVAKSKQKRTIQRVKEWVQSERVQCRYVSGSRVIEGCDTKPTFNKVKGNSMEYSYIVTGMTCQHCVQNVQNKLQSAEGVQSVAVQLMPPRAIVQAQTDVFPVLQAALQGTKFVLSPMDTAI